MPISAPAIILRWRNKLTIKKMLKKGLVEGVSQLPCRRNQSIPTSTSPEQGPWGQQLQNQGITTPPCTASWTSWFTCSRTRYREYNSYSHNSMVKKWPFFNCTWKNIVIIQSFTSVQYFWWMCFPVLRICNLSEHSYLGHREPERDSTTWITYAQWKVAVWCAGHANRGWMQVTLIMEESEESTTIKLCTVSSVRSSTTPKECAFQQDGDPSHVSRAICLFFLKRFWIHGLKEITQHVGQQDHRT